MAARPVRGSGRDERGGCGARDRACCQTKNGPTIELNIARVCRRHELPSQSLFASARTLPQKREVSYVPGKWRRRAGRRHGFRSEERRVGKEC